jgi:branched-chain amino acid transport system ATP-binding protein
MLHIDQLSGGYGALTVLRSVSLSVQPGQIMVVLGANGAGKSTLLRCISGLLPVTSGRVAAFGQTINGMAPHRLVKLGLSHIPEGRGIFGELTVRENLELGSFAWAGARRSRIENDLERIFALFPILEERAGAIAGTLSGGQQQMLAIGRALMSRPKLLLLDEPSLGLAPLAVRMILDTLVTLRNEGLGILLVEQNARAALAIADQACVLELGTITAQGSARELAADAAIQRGYLGGTAPPPSD